MEELKKLNIAECPDSDLRKSLQVMSDHYPLVFNESSDTVFDVILEKDNRAKQSLLAIQNNRATIRYVNSAQAMRHIGALLSSCTEGKAEYAESTPLETIGIMLDCSRNAVMKVEHFQEWLRRLTLMGYNMAMLYTEDTYELPGEPFFGYQRGAYTSEELKAIDDYAASLGIEMIGCIQTLGHLEQILKWGDYRDIKDSPSVIMVDDDRSYDLIGKMLDNYAECYKSRRIHIGMDETFGLGRGGFLERYGLQDQFEIFNRHLKRVTQMCLDRDLEPMIWSDMYFRIGSKSHEYYDTGAEIPEKVVEAIPEDVQLVYWDYYHDAPEDYEAMIDLHRKMNHEPIMGSGVWTWGSGNLWHDFNNTTQKAGACVEACRKSGLKEIFFTLWGDDGATCDIDSCLAGLAWVAEKCYNPDDDQTTFERRFDRLNDSSFEGHRIAAGLQSPIRASSTIWDDPLLRMYLLYERSKNPEILKEAAEHYNALSEKIKTHIGRDGAGSFEYLNILFRTLSDKCDLAEKLHIAWKSKDKKVIHAIVEELPALIRQMTELSDQARKRWYAVKKAQGLEVVQIRYAGQIARLEELRDRLELWLEGSIETIEELDTDWPEDTDNWMPGQYHRVATGSNIL